MGQVTRHFAGVDVIYLTSVTAAVIRGFCRWTGHPRAATPRRRASELRNRTPPAPVSYLSNRVR